MNTYSQGGQGRAARPAGFGFELAILPMVQSLYVYTGVARAALSGLLVAVGFWLAILLVVQWLYLFTGLLGPCRHE